MGVSCAAAGAARAPMMKRFVASYARALRTARRCQSQTLHVPSTPQRQFVVAKSSKASKSGRFPPTPCTDNRPLSRPPPAAVDTAPHANDGQSGGGSGVGGGGSGGGGVAGVAGQHQVDDGGGGDDAIGQLCARWRAAAGKPGAAVMREVQAMLNPTSNNTLTPTSSTDDDAQHEGWRLLLTHKNENLYNAYALEVAALSPGSYGLTTGLFAVPRPLQHALLARMVGLRAVVVGALYKLNSRDPTLESAWFHFNP
jgi:hypothetical protein